MSEIPVLPNTKVVAWIQNRIQFLLQQKVVELGAVSAKYNASINELNSLLAAMGAPVVDVQKQPTAPPPPEAVRRVPRPAPDSDVRTPVQQMQQGGGPIQPSKGNGGGPSGTPPPVPSGSDIMRTVIKKKR